MDAPSLIVAQVSGKAAIDNSDRGMIVTQPASNICPVGREGAIGDGFKRIDVEHAASPVIRMSLHDIKSIEPGKTVNPNCLHHMIGSHRTSGLVNIPTQDGLVLRPVSLLRCGFISGKTTIKGDTRLQVKRIALVVIGGS